MSHERVLYFLQNSRALRVAWLLEELNLRYTLRHYSRVQAKLGESSAIMKYLIERYAPSQNRTHLLGMAGNWQERADVESWFSFSEHMVVHTLAVVYPRWSSDEQSATRIEHSMSANIHNILDLLDATLRDAQQRGWRVSGGVEVDCSGYHESGKEQGGLAEYGGLA